MSDSAPSAVASEPLYLKPAEVATLTQISVKTWYRIVAADSSVPCLRISGSLRFPKDRLLAWLRAKEQGPGRARRVVDLAARSGAP